MTSNDYQLESYYEVLSRASSFLEKKNHSAFVAEWLLRERLSWSKTDLVMHYQQPIQAEVKKQFEADLAEFMAGKPIQQVIGHTWFYDRKFKVTKDTLIPRPETEEWIDRVLKLLPADRAFDVLDIGTGTGVLAITMQLERPNDTVLATDISPEALQVAQKNNQLLEGDVSFRLGSLFEPVKDQRFDVILCNPPYISLDEIPLMDETVLNHEPKQALFADNKGLALYEEMAETIADHLTPGGYAFFEIGFAQGEAVSEIFKEKLPDAQIEVWQDINQLDRVVAIFL